MEMNGDFSEDGGGKKGGGGAVEERREILVFFLRIFIGSLQLSLPLFSPVQLIFCRLLSHSFFLHLNKPAAHVRVCVRVIIPSFNTVKRRKNSPSLSTVS